MIHLTCGSAFFFDDLDHVADRIDHTTHGRCIFQLACAVHLVQAQTDQRGTLFGGAADRNAC